MAYLLICIFFCSYSKEEKVLLFCVDRGTEMGIAKNLNQLQRNEDVFYHLLKSMGYCLYFIPELDLDVDNANGIVSRG